LQAGFGRSHLGPGSGPGAAQSLLGSPQLPLGHGRLGAGIVHVLSGGEGLAIQGLDALQAGLRIGRLGPGVVLGRRSRADAGLGRLPGLHQIGLGRGHRGLLLAQGAGHRGVGRSLGQAGLGPARPGFGQLGPALVHGLLQLTSIQAHQQLPLADPVAGMDLEFLDPS